jgi:hypothetical protein
MGWNLTTMWKPKMENAVVFWLCIAILLTFFLIGVL